MPAVWTGSITFGLVTIPVKLHTATTSNQIAFNSLHRACNGRIQQKQICPACGVDLKREDTVRGYEYAKSQYIVLQDEELEKLEPEASRAIEIKAFVPGAQLDPLYFDRAYYLIPDEVAERAYALLLRAMDKAGRVALGKMTMRNRDHLILLRPRPQGLLLQTLYYADEIKAFKEWSLRDVAVSDRELDLAHTLMEGLPGSFEPEAYKDAYRERLLELIRAKAEGRELVVPEARKETAQVISLMEALERSVAAVAGPKKPIARVTEPQPAAKPAARGRRKA